MCYARNYVCCLTIILCCSVLVLSPVDAADWRHITNGSVIPDEEYADQPYVVVLNDGSWLCLLTTGPGGESAPGQHIVSTRSADQGKTWSNLVDIEPSVPDKRAASSWVVPLHVPTIGDPGPGRVYAFYTYNGDHVDVPGKDRDTAVGWYVFKFSDDGGRTWSKDRYRVPVPYSKVDLSNDSKDLPGAPHLNGWSVCKPTVKDGHVHIAFCKKLNVNADGGEGWIFTSPNLMTEPNPAKIKWTFSPDPDDKNPKVYMTGSALKTEADWSGLRNDEVAKHHEEQVLASLAGPGRLVMVERTTEGFPGISYSADNGRSWTPPVALTYEPGGSRVIKHPRANTKVWRTRDGKYLLWHHFNGTKGFRNRNPVWLSAGVEDREGKLRWSQPEVLLYHSIENYRYGMSYPDLIEVDGRFWITETQKKVARVHEIDGAYLETLFRWDRISKVAGAGKVIDVNPGAGPHSQALPRLASLKGASAGGFTLDFQVRFKDLDAGQTIADNRDTAGRGFLVETARDGRLQVSLNDGSSRVVWNTEKGAIQPDRLEHIALVVDGQADVISWVVNGERLDGGKERDFGWTRSDHALGDVNGAGKLTIAKDLNGTINKFRLYSRALMTTELIGNFRAESGERERATRADNE